MENFKNYDVEKNESQYKDLWPAYYNLLSQHGIDNPILSKTIEVTLGIKGSAVRGLLNYGLHQGVLILTSNEGYALSADRETAYPYLHHLKERVAALEARIALSEALIDNMPRGEVRRDENTKQ
jgi:lipoate-protein ligase A